MSNTQRMGDDDELWRDFERSDLVDFMRSISAEGSTVDLTLPEYLGFSREQRLFISSLVAHVVEDLTYELSHKWARHMIDVLVAGEWQVPDDAEPVTAPDPRDAPS